MPKGSIKAPGSKNTTAYRGAQQMMNGQSKAAKDLNVRFKKKVGPVAAVKEYGKSRAAAKKAQPKSGW